MLCFARMMAEDTDETTQTLSSHTQYVWASQAAADPFNQFISFGDSTADSGWWSGALWIVMLVELASGICTGR